LSRRPSLMFARGFDPAGMEMPMADVVLPNGERLKMRDQGPSRSNAETWVYNDDFAARVAPDVKCYFWPDVRFCSAYFCPICRLRPDPGACKVCGEARLKGLLEQDERRELSLQDVLPFLAVRTRDVFFERDRVLHLENCYFCSQKCADEHERTLVARPKDQPIVWLNPLKEPVLNPDPAAPPPDVDDEFLELELVAFSNARRRFEPIPEDFMSKYCGAWTRRLPLPSIERCTRLLARSSSCTIL